MPREGTQHHIDDRWRERVTERLAEMGKTAAWLSRESGCPKSMISELLSGLRDHTTYLPEIHKALNLPDPHGPLLSRDDEELLTLSRTLDAEQRGALKERARTLKEEQAAAGSRKKSPTRPR